jgi:hypothetical protein
VGHFADGSRYSYWPDEPDAINVGWLDADQPFSVGEVWPGVVEALVLLCREGVRRTRGVHRCPLCLVEIGQDWPPRSNVIADDRGEYLVGSAEIRVAGPGGVTYAAPDLVVHYVRAHGYRPPDEFQAAVLAAVADRSR